MKYIVVLGDGMADEPIAEIGGKTPLTQREIAQVLGISRSYVSRIEKSALATLKSALE